MLPGRQGEGVLGPLFTHRDHFDEATAVAAEVPAGSLVFFSPHSVHGSLPNRSERPRRALVLTYQPGGTAHVQGGPRAERRRLGELAAACSNAARSSS